MGCTNCKFYLRFDFPKRFLQFAIVAWKSLPISTQYNCVDRWVTVGWMLGDCKVTVGWLLGDCWVTVGRLLGDCWVTVGWLLGDCWVTVGWLLGDCWVTFGWLLSDCRVTVEWLVGDCWVTVGWPSGDRWVTVEWLLFVIFICRSFFHEKEPHTDIVFCRSVIFIFLLGHNLNRNYNWFYIPEQK